MHTHPALPQGRKKIKKNLCNLKQQKNPNKKSLEKDLLLGKIKLTIPNVRCRFWFVFLMLFPLFSLSAFSTLRFCQMTSWCPFLLTYNLFLGIVQMMDYALYPRIRDPRFREPAVGYWVSLKVKLIVSAFT
jgi:hypothetical protein